jgi:glucose/arabinose dehydrogenase
MQQLRIVKDEQLAANPISGLPKNIYVKGQGGLLDVAINPEFSTDYLVYISYAGHGKGGAGTEVARGRLINNRLEPIETIFIVRPKTAGSLHYGSRLVFASDGTLFITTCDRYDRLHDAQKPSNHLGSIIRINDDGTIPKDNPFIDHESYQAETYSYGHRNAQGITMRPFDQSIWAHEHGPRGGDEVNKLKTDANYGWPTITYGIDYSGAIISDKTQAAGMEHTCGVLGPFNCT